eukprot:Pgem_evm1s11336
MFVIDNIEHFHQDNFDLKSKVNLKITEGNYVYDKFGYPQTTYTIKISNSRQ